jgi:hypothetical protein
VSPRASNHYLPVPILAVVQSFDAGGLSADSKLENIGDFLYDCYGYQGIKMIVDKLKFSRPIIWLEDSKKRALSSRKR